MVMYITNLRKIFIYGVKRDQYNKFIGIRELLKILALDCFKIYFQLILGLWQRTHLYLMRQMIERHFILDVQFMFLVLLLVSHRSELFMTSPSIELHCQPLIQWNLLLNLGILLKKEGASQIGSNNGTNRGYYQRRLPNGRICLNRTLWFFNGHTRLNKHTYYYKQVVCDCFATYLDSLVHHC